jgi:hypothetical protein
MLKRVLITIFAIVAVWLVATGRATWRQIVQFVLNRNPAYKKAKILKNAIKK